MYASGSVPCLQYKKTCKLTRSLVDPLAAPCVRSVVTGGPLPWHRQCIACLRGSSADCVSLALPTGTQEAKQLQIAEGQITWLVHIIAAVIRGRLSSAAAESQEVIDGALSARIFALLHVIDAG